MQPFITINPMHFAKKLCLLYCLFPALAWGQGAFWSRGTVSPQAFCDTIPFEWVEDKIIINVNIQGKNRRFLFDTGAPLLIFDALQAEMNNPALKTVKTSDVTGQGREQETVWVGALQIGSITFRDVPALVIDYNEIGIIQCFDIEGFIGSNALRNCVVHIDAERQHLIIADRFERLALVNPQKVRLRLDGSNRPWVRIGLGNRIKTMALFDSGSGKLLDISEQTLTKTQQKQISRIVRQGFGSTSSGLYGPGQVRPVLRVATTSLNIGNAAINNIITTAPVEKPRDAMGLGLAAFGAITIDYPNKAFYFSPKAQTQVFNESKSFGFSYQFDRDHFRIGVVYEGTPAAKAGLKSGYRLVRVNEMDLSENVQANRCKLFLSGFLQQPVIAITFLDEAGRTQTVELTVE